MENLTVWPYGTLPASAVREGRVREVCQQPSGGPGQRVHVARRRAPGLRYGRVRRFQGRSRALGSPVQGHGRLMTPLSVGGAHRVSALSFSPLHSREYPGFSIFLKRQLVYCCKSRKAGQAYLAKPFTLSIFEERTLKRRRFNARRDSLPLQPSLSKKRNREGLDRKSSSFFFLTLS